MELIGVKQGHRGPDIRNALVIGRHAFCHQRLAFVDIDGGHQPFEEPSGRYLIVYNGEIYNHMEIRHELANFYAFTTESDTEVILAAFMVWGEACLQRFIGMYAFLIWDKQEERAFAARDPLGVKPFVYYSYGSTFMFASELKALKEIIDCKLEIDTTALTEYIIAPWLSGGGDRAIFKNIHYLEAGGILKITEQGVSKYRNDHFKWNPSSFTENELVNRVGEAMEDSVRLSLRANVPVGIFLSGGLDSSLIAAIAKKYSREPIEAFSVAFERDSDIHFDPATIVNADDLPHAKEIAKELSLSFQEVLVDHSCLAASLRTLAVINDRIPAWEQELSQHFLSQFATKKCKIILVGDGADETNYGYSSLLNKTIEHGHMDLVRLFDGEKRLRLLSPHLKEIGDSIDNLKNQYRDIALQAGYDFDKGGEESVLAISSLICSRWLDRLMHNGDIHTMHYSLESRLPFANRNLLDVISQVAPRYGFKDGIGKNILRRVAERWLPKQYCARKESFFPKDPRLGKAYQTILSQLLEEKNDFIDTYLHRPELISLCDLEEVEESDRMLLFNMICLIYWSKEYCI